MPLKDTKAAVVDQTTVRAGIILLLQNIGSQVLGAAGAISAVADLGREIGASAEEMADAVLKNTVPGEVVNTGPTLKEFVAAGYDPHNYPPPGYPAKTDPSDAEVWAEWYAAHPVPEPVVAPDASGAEEPEAEKTDEAPADAPEEPVHDA